MADFDTDEDLSVFEQSKAEARAFCVGKSLIDLVTLMQEYANEKTEAEEALKIANAWYDVIRFEAIPEKMDGDGITSVRYEGIGRVGLTGDMLVSVKGGAKEALYAWLKDNGLGDLVQPSINSSTLKAFVKRRIKDAKPYPEGFLNVTPITRASITKA